MGIGYFICSVPQASSGLVLLMVGNIVVVSVCFLATAALLKKKEFFLESGISLLDPLESC